VGTNAAGTSALPNSGNGLQLTTDGPVSAYNNVISGNLSNGIYAEAPGSVFLGNTVGSDAGGDMDLGNAGNGIYAAAPNIVVGGTGGGHGNTVAFNGEAGILVGTPGALRSTGGPPPETTGVIIFGNDVYENGGLGIDLDPDEAVNANDEDDPDGGANNGQNWPLLLSARQGSTKIAGVLNSTPSREFRIEFFASDDCDPSGNGEGAAYFGAATATTNAGGNTSFSVTSPATIAVGRFITATATDLVTLDTSEFSNCVEVEAAPTPEPTLPPGQTPTPTPTGLTPTPTDIPFETEGPTPTEPPEETEPPLPTPTPTVTPGPTGTGPTPTGVTPTPTPTQTATATATPTPTAGSSETPGTERTQGDVQCDGDVDSVDALQQLREVAGLATFQEDGCPAIGSAGAIFGDVDCDGDVDSVDALKVLRHVAALSVAQTEPCTDIGEPLA
jgi:hypothetical protein